VRPRPKAVSCDRTPKRPGAAESQRDVVPPSSTNTPGANDYCSEHYPKRKSRQFPGPGGGSRRHERFSREATGFEGIPAVPSPAGRAQPPEGANRSAGPEKPGDARREEPRGRRGPPPGRLTGRASPRAAATCRRDPKRSHATALQSGRAPPKAKEASCRRTPKRPGASCGICAGTVLEEGDDAQGIYNTRNKGLFFNPESKVSVSLQPALCPACPMRWSAKSPFLAR